MRIAGIDPSLNNFGLAKGTYDGAFDLSELRLIQTGADKKNQKQVRVNSDDLRRARELHTGLHEFISDVDLVFVEVPVGSQSARSMASYGVCIGILSSIKKPMIEVTPNEVKLAAVGRKTATKAEMIEWAVGQYSTANWLTQKKHGKQVVTAKNEHLADAVAAVHAGMQTATFQQLLSFHRTIAQ